MRVVYMGTPDFAVGALEAIIAAGHEVIAVVTQPDKPRGRGKEMQISDVKACALKHNLSVFQPVKIRDEESVTYLKGLKADIFVVAAFGQILSQEVLDIPKYGCVNIHASLLPKYRGASPINQVLIEGDEYTGITVMKMNAGMDTGNIMLQEKLRIEEDDTAGTLFDKLSELGAKVIVTALEKIEDGTITETVQDENLSSRCAKMHKEMGHINWAQDVFYISRLVRALNPWPSCFTLINGKMLKIWKAKAVEGKSGEAGVIASVGKDSFTVNAGNGLLEVFEVQLEGKRRMNVSDFLRGFKFVEGETKFE